MRSDKTKKKKHRKYCSKNICSIQNVNESKEDVQLLKDFTDKVGIFEATNIPQLQSQLPNNINDLTRLSELDVHTNDLPKFYQILCHLDNLKKLFLYNNLLKSVPNEIVVLQNLKILNLSHNELTELPDNLSDLKKLEWLNLSYNKLNNLPVVYKNLRLNHLDISGNNFKILPECISNGLGTLQFLNISENPGIEMNIIPNSKHLKEFYARKNKNCKNFPHWILSQKFLNLKKIDLEETFFDNYNFVRKEEYLSITHFSINSSNLKDSILENLILNMVKLENLNVGNNITSYSVNMFDDILIDAFKNPSLLREINVCKTNISSVPKTINKLCNLKKLDISSNNITWFPEEFCELHKLEYLKIDGNELIMLPKKIGNLKLLREIRAENNLLTRLPKSFKNLKNLRFADFYNNLLEKFPSVLKKIKSLQGLDLEQNLFSTENIIINEITYTNLYKNYSSLPDIKSQLKSRWLGFKKLPSIESEDSSDKSCYNSDKEQYNTYNDTSDDEIKTINCSKSVNNNIEENWDSVSDTDDEFEPGLKSNVDQRLKRHTLDYSNGFCPADLHSEKIAVEVAFMSQNDSLAKYVVEQGQFDDV